MVLQIYNPRLLSSDSLKFNNFPYVIFFVESLLDNNKVVSLNNLIII